MPKRESSKNDAQTSAGLPATEGIARIVPESPLSSKPGRPASGFLAQYIDQHFPWPRRPERKERQRQRAERAYLETENLPEILADALRIRVNRQL